MPSIIVRAVDYNTGKAISQAFVDLSGYTGYTDAKGEVSLTVPATGYSLKVLHKDYTAYVYPVTIQADTKVVQVRLIPQVRML